MNYNVSKHSYTIVCNEIMANRIEGTFSLWKSHGDIVSWERGIYVEKITSQEKPYCHFNIETVTGC